MDLAWKTDLPRNYNSTMAISDAGRHFLDSAVQLWRQVSVIITHGASKRLLTRL